MLVSAACGPSCTRRPESPQVALENANQAFIRGDLQESKNQARRRFDELRKSSPQLAWKFKLLEAKAALWQGLFEDVLQFLSSEPLPRQPDLAIPTLTFLGVAHAHLRQYPEAERVLQEASELCGTHVEAGCGDALQARGLLASEEGDSASAEEFYRRSVLFARAHDDLFLESTAFLNLGAESLAQGRFDEAIDRSQAAYQAARTIGAHAVEPLAQGNVGWACYRLGDADKALDLFLQAENRAGEIQDFVDQGVWLTDAGYVYMDAGNVLLAQQSFQQALTIEQKVNSREHIYNALRVLARLGVQTNGLDKAAQYADQARQLARESGIHSDELYPMLVQGQVAAQRRDTAQARQLFAAVEHDKACPVFLKWEAQHSLAQLYEHQNQAAAADRQFRAALATFEAARATVRREDFQLSFLANAARIYDDYVHFLVAQGKTEQALRWADYSRARTLSQGLGLLSKEGVHSGASQIVSPALNAQSLPRRANGTILFYWLGQKQSYLWTITSQAIRLFRLPPGPEIEAIVRRYRGALNGPENILESSDDGRTLYRILIRPAQSFLRRNSRVFVLADGELNNLNFETLIVGTPKPHFWIEDADVINSSSLRVLSASLTATNHPRPRLLLVGDSISPNKDYPELPKAADQMDSVARHFPSAQCRVYRREQATPSAYLQSNPEQFSYIHFVAHGIASRLSPLDSAIVLSKEPANPDSFKLYARDITQHPIRAQLVTISACYGAGERRYSGEGLVGLAWAFLRAGSRNVIAALWEATDVSTDQLMDRFYRELGGGATPDAALRTAKLAMLQGGRFRNPFYWAAFQLFTG